MATILERAIDRLVLAVAPQVACRRLGARALYQELESKTRRYEGAARGRRTKNWRTPSTDSNAAVSSSIETLRNRSRDLVRNNVWAKRAVNSIAAYTVGSGIRPNAKADDSGKARAIEGAFARWAESTESDLEGSSDFYGLQSLVMAGVAESGGVLVRRIRTSETTIPLALQVLEPDHLDTTRREGLNGNPVVLGVELDKVTHQRLAYWLYPDHPGSDWPIRSRFESERVPVSEVLHVFRRDRPGQIQGVPWGATTIILLRNFDEYQDAQVVRQLLGACFTGIVKGTEGADVGNPALGPNQKPPLQELEPGAILHLAAGQDIVFSKPPEVEGYEEFARQSLRAVSAGFDVPYQVLAQDLSNVNFSSGRMGANDFQLHIETWRNRILLPQFLRPVWRWFLEAAVAAGELPLKSLEAGVGWTAPARVQVNLAEEVKADTEAVRGGFKTLFECIRERGRDPEEVLEEHRQTNELLDELGLKLQSDPRHFAAPGSSPSQGGAAADEDTSRADSSEAKPKKPKKP